MKGLRSTSEGGQATRHLGRLNLTHRSVTLIGGTGQKASGPALGRVGVPQGGEGGGGQVHGGPAPGGGRGPGGGEELGGRGHEVLGAPAQPLGLQADDEEVGLGGEVVEDGAAGDPGEGGDVVDRHGDVAALAGQAERRRPDGGAGAARVGDAEVGSGHASIMHSVQDCTQCRNLRD